MWILSVRNSAHGSCSGVCDMQLYVWRYVPGDNYLTEQPYFTSDRILDDAVSVVWCERYQEPGEFVLLLRATPELLRYFADNTILLSREGSDTAMFVETVTLTTSAQDGNYLRISGRSAESVIYERIIRQTDTQQGRPDELIYYYIRENADSYWYFHTDATHRKQQRYKYINLLEPDDYAPMQGATDAQPFGQSVGAFAETMCKAFRFGFRIRFVNGKFLYSCYKGDDRSVGQNVLPAVIFAEEFENLADTVYSLDRSGYYNRVVIGGEGEGKDRIVAEYSDEITKNAGLLMRETFVDAKTVSSNVDSDVSYVTLLQRIAIDSVNSKRIAQSFGGDILPGGQFTNRKDYFLGDTVTVRNAYGITGTAVVSEVVETEDDSGYRLIPTFKDWVVIEND